MKRDAFSRCHPLVNFLFFLGAIGFGMVIQHPVYIAAGCLAAAGYCLLLSPGTGWKLVLGMVPLFAFIALINPLFNTYGKKVLFTVFGRPYCLEALYYGMAIAGILVVMLLWFFCYSRILTSDKFLCLFGSLIPALSLLLTMVLRLIPNLMRKGGQLLGSRRSIGMGAAKESTPKEKLRDGMTLLSALTDWALEGSIITGDSMRSRGYGCARRTSFQIYTLTGRDILLTAAMAVLAGAVLLLGGFDATFTPVLYWDRVGWGFAAYCVFLLIPIALHVKEILVWHISVSRI
ncbi:MAG: hypothetical protein IJA75_06085 [Oscillospiraceae bacterium]|nr:hypothetical protein [Oscillospiraceae bacterium]